MLPLPDATCFMFFRCQTFSCSCRCVDLIPLYRLPVISLMGSRSSKTVQYVSYNIMLNNTRLVLLFSICSLIHVFPSIRIMEGYGIITECRE